jgi:hypothetical protein
LALAAGRVRVQPTACLHREVGRFLHGLHGTIARRLPQAIIAGRSLSSWPRPGARFLQRPRARRPNDFFPPCGACPVLPAGW